MAILWVELDPFLIKHVFLGFVPDMTPQPSVTQSPPCSTDWLDVSPQDRRQWGPSALFDIWKTRADWNKTAGVHASSVITHMCTHLTSLSRRALPPGSSLDHAAISHLSYRNNDPSSSYILRNLLSHVFHDTRSYYWTVSTRGGTGEDRFLVALGGWSAQAG